MAAASQCVFVAVEDSPLLVDVIQDRRGCEGPYWLEDLGDVVKELKSRDE